MQPANLFVGGFIGSPATNFMTAPVMGAAARTTVSTSLSLTTSVRHGATTLATQALGRPTGLDDVRQ